MVAQAGLDQAEDVFPARFSAPSGSRESQNQRSGEKDGRTMNSLTQSKNTFILPILIAMTLACFALAPTARAVTPAPDGGYPGENAAEGEDALFSLSTGIDNTANGFNALYFNTVGSYNTAIGSNALYTNIGSYNTATGSSALYSNTGGFDNTATGYYALYSNTMGSGNTAMGWNALLSNTTGGANTAIGFNALATNSIGEANTATGGGSLVYNSTGSDNTGTGYFSLHLNSTGIENTANGVNALYSNTTGNDNTAVGDNALFGNTTGNVNTAIGANSLQQNTTGVNNTAMSVHALYSNTTGDNNTAIGANSLINNTTGSSNIALGNSAGQNLTSGSNNIDIGNLGAPGDSKTIRIGTAATQRKTFIAGISGATVASGVGVIVGSNGQLGTVVSSQRFKDNVKPMDKASEAILALKPVTFRYKHELDPSGIPQFGLVAEEVEKINPALVARDDEGKAYTVRYDAVNAMLLNEFLKEHRKVTEQEATIEQLKEELLATATRQQNQIEALTAGLQKVNARLQLSKSAPQSVVNN